MAALSRREFLKTAATDAAVAGFLAAGVAELRANPLGLPIGSQTYPHRQMIKDGNFAGLAKALADIGVQTIEMCSPLGYSDFASLSDGKQVRTILSDHGLTCVSGHFGMRELGERQSESIAWARDVGITQMITASLGGGKKLGPDLAGVPALSQPCGFTKAGLPIGLQIIAPALGEETCFRVAAAYEARTKWHEQLPPEAGS